MANFLINLISEISGYENFQKCLEICDIVDFNELLSIDESTLDRMEIFLQKKCSRMHPTERNKFIGDRFVNNPSIFQFSPATRQRILTVIKNLEKMFTNPLLPININSISDLCNRLSTSNISAITSVPLNSMEVILKQNYLVNPFENNIHLTSLTNSSNGTQQSLISETKSNSGSTKSTPKMDYSNIFQKMNSLRENFTKLPDNLNNGNDENISQTRKEFPFEITKIDGVDSNKENKNQRRVNKRSVDIDVNESQLEQPTKKARRISNRILNELSLQPDKMLPERLRSQRLINKSKLNKTIESLENTPDNNMIVNVIEESQENNQALTVNYKSSEHSKEVNEKLPNTSHGQNNLLLLETGEPNLLNNVAKPDNFEIKDQKNTVVISPPKLTNGNNIDNSAEQDKKQSNHKSTKVPKIKSSSKHVQSANTMVSDSVTNSNISKQLSKFRGTPIKNSSNTSYPSWLSQTNATSSGDKGKNNSPSTAPGVYQTGKIIQKSSKISPRRNQSDKTKVIKSKSPASQNPLDVVSNNRRPANISRQLNRNLDTLTKTELDPMTNLTVKTLKPSSQDRLKDVSSSQMPVITNNASKFISHAWQMKSSPPYREIANTSESGASATTVSKSHSISTVQIYIEPNLPKPIVPQRVQLSDVPFQCFDSPTLSKKLSCIRLKRPAQSAPPKTVTIKPPSNLSVTKLAPCRFQPGMDANTTPMEKSADVGGDSNPVSVISSTDVKPVATNSAHIQQKTTHRAIPITTIIKDSESNKIPVIRASFNHSLGNVSTTQDKSIDIQIHQQTVTATDSQIALVVDKVSRPTLSQPPFTSEPSWISRPSFITDRFINSTKHIRSGLANGIKAECKLPTDSENPSNI